MSAVYSVRVDADMDSKLDFLVNKTGHKKSYYIKNAIQEYLMNKEDYFKAVDALAAMERGEELSDWKDVKKRLGF